ncbi:MAG: hypothetical protein DI629_20845 [Mesorhizobium amorphae]|nr:MAG: hypothetical protein DI629_20845 [Mesorhizobium amorphae]
MRAEIFARRADDAGDWMVCGYAAAPLKAGFHDFLIGNQGNLLAFTQPEGVTEIRDDVVSRAGSGEHANLVTQAAWVRLAFPGAPVLQLHARPIAREPRFIMIVGVLQDPDATATAEWRPDGEMLLVSPLPDLGAKIAVDPSRPDLSFSQGNSLVNVHKQPIWNLGEPEPWGARFTMDPYHTEAAIGAMALRELIAAGIATDIDKAEMEDLVRKSDYAVQMPEGKFGSFLEEMIRIRGLIGEISPLVTESENSQTEEHAREAMRRVLGRNLDEPSP